MFAAGFALRHLHPRPRIRHVNAIFAFRQHLHSFVCFTSRRSLTASISEIKTSSSDKYFIVGNGRRCRRQLGKPEKSTVIFYDAVSVVFRESI